MDNTKPNWLGQWGRSPRQDRRVVIDGKFVEQAPPVYPAPDPEPEVNTALEVVQETAPVHENVNTTEIVNIAEQRAQEKIDELQRPLSPKEVVDLATDIVIDHAVKQAAKELGVTESEKLQAELEPIPTDVDKTMHILPMPTIPSEAWQFVEQAQQVEEVITGTAEPAAVLPAPVQDSASEGVLDGQAGRTENNQK